MMDNVDPQEYEEFAAEYRANNHDAKDGEIILASLHRNKNSKVSKQATGRRVWNCY